MRLTPFSRPILPPWLIAHDVNEARQKLNFSDWDVSGNKRDITGKIYDEVSGGDMPLPIYIFMHENAIVSDEGISLLKAWSETATKP